jgi:hypothetical protein
MCVRLVRMIALMRYRRRTPLTIHPPGITIDVVLFLPNRDAMFDLVDDVSTGTERLVAMSSTDTDPHSHLADREITNAVNASRMFYAELLNGLGDDALAFFDR